MNDREKIELNKIATRLNFTLRKRGDLETRYIDEEDFIIVPVWELKEMMKQAYKLGKNKII